jgi:endonuclease/exonuclease/phosphatase family metal-dependent hydrolase
MTSIATWNLHHMTREALIPPGVLEVIAAVRPDVLVLTEYVDGGNRKAFISGLEALGYKKPLASTNAHGHNQVLIACQVRHDRGHIEAPTYTTSASSNFLHCHLPDTGLHVIGVRAPYYKMAAERDRYWEQLEQAILAGRNLDAAVIGDLNWQRRERRTRRGLAIRRLLDEGFTMPIPEGPWSFMSADGDGTSVIDHAILSPSMRCISSRYIYQAGGHFLAGPALAKPISDHAMLWVDVVQAGR